MFPRSDTPSFRLCVEMGVGQMSRLIRAKKGRRSSGFTLIELLVVIAIIAVLAAILFPVFLTAKKAAQQSACAQNTRQISTAALLYLQDSHDVMPNATSEWYCDDLSVGTMITLLRKYTKNTNIFNCPSARKWDDKRRVYTVYNNYNPNGVLFGNPPLYNSIRASAVTSRTGTAMFSELGWNYYLCCNRPLQINDDEFMWWWDTSWSGTKQHNGGANLIFVDGHVKWVRFEAFHSGMLGLSPDDYTSIGRGVGGRTYKSIFN